VDPGAIVIGGGFGGLTTAIGLTQAGVDATIYEASDELREVGAGVGVQYGAMKALRRIGLLDAVQEMGEPLRNVEMRSWDGKLLAEIPHAPLAEKLGVRAHNVHRGELLGLLMRTLGRDRIVLGSKCVGYIEDENGVTAQFADGSSARGAVLVGADGSHSTIRPQLLGDGMPRDSRIVVWRAIPDFESPALPRGVLQMVFGRSQFFAMITAVRGRVFWFASGLVRKFGSKPAVSPKEEVVEAYAGWAEPIEELLSITDESGIARNLTYDRPPVDRWSTARITLVGDAAHPMRPTLGQGASSAIEDGVVLARELSQVSLGDTAAIRSALRAYETDRIARTTPLVRRAARLERLAMSRNPVVRTMRNVALRATPAAAWQRSYMSQHDYDV
jgi:2-polyprenyl-6-methoxyphenol hydroxylase-like FAD-dependent oxidoreductase